MTQGAAKRILFDIVSRFFAGATVVWSGQNRSAIPHKPFIRMTAGNLKRNRFPASSIVDGVPVNAYACWFSLQIDLFTHGREIPDSEQRENTAAEDLSALVDYLDSEYVSDLCFKNDISIEYESDVLDLSAAIYDANYEFRAEVTLTIRYTHRAVGHAGTYGEETVKVVEITDTDPDTGEEITVDTKETVDLTEPFEPSASGGNTEELARNTDCGYFTAVEIEYDRSED